MENHGACGNEVLFLTRVVDAFDSPRLGYTLDTGNFLEDPYEQMESLAASDVPISLVQAKTYYGGGRWYALVVLMNKYCPVRPRNRRSRSRVDSALRAQ